MGMALQHQFAHRNTLTTPSMTGKKLRPPRGFLAQVRQSLTATEVKQNLARTPQGSQQQRRRQMAMDFEHFAAQSSYLAKNQHNQRKWTSGLK